MPAGLMHLFSHLDQAGLSALPKLDAHQLKTYNHG